MRRMTGNLGATRERIAPLVKALADAAGKNLLMAAVYGSAARGDFDPDRSDINLLVVLEDVSTTALRKLVSVLQMAKAQDRCAPFILSREELERGVDVFPVKFHEIRRFYEIVHGDDLLASVRVEFRDLRLACEHELRNATLKLRRAWIAEQPKPDLAVFVLRQFVPQVLDVLRVVLEREGFKGEMTGDGLAIEIALRFDLDVTRLKKAVATSCDPRAPWPPVEAAYDTILTLLDRATRLVDHWSAT
jgi:predicted nucleotidyltransferase